MENLFELFKSPRNWTEDYNHENGNYTCTCTECKEIFIGHKRRTVCKECATKEFKVGSLDWLVRKLSEQGWKGFQVDEILATVTEFVRLKELEKSK